MIGVPMLQISQEESKKSASETSQAVQSQEMEQLGKSGLTYNASYSYDALWRKLHGGYHRQLCFRKNTMEEYL